jgi:hypothetical protein
MQPVSLKFDLVAFFSSHNRKAAPAGNSPVDFRSSLRDKALRLLA